MNRRAVPRLRSCACREVVRLHAPDGDRKRRLSSIPFGTGCRLTDDQRHFAVVHSEALPFLDDNLEVVLIEHAARVLRAEEPDRTTVLLQ